MSVKLASSLPAPKANGLNAIAKDLIRDPARTKVIVAIIDTKSVTTESDTGEVIPTVRIQYVEAVLRSDMVEAREILQRAMEARTGQVALPLELENAVRAAFEDVTT